MSPTLATLLTVVGIIVLLWRDSRHGEARSPALWLPVMWLGITGSRFISQWMNLSAGAGDNFSEGSPIDAAYFGALIVCGALVVAQRPIDFGAVIRANIWIVALTFYALLSVTWSDDPLIAGKRWFKTLGHPIMALVILTDPDPKAALRTVAKRVAIVLLPLSVLFIKYLPEYGRGFDAFNGMPVNNGAALTKNDLGYVCMISAVFMTWNLLALSRIGDVKARRYELALCGGLLAMAIWLLNLSDSMTSLATMTAGIGVMLAVTLQLISHRQFAASVLTVAAIAWALEASFGLYETIIVMLGRNPTLTDRTIVWEQVLAMQERPLIGYGFESFWLGERLEQLWARWWWRPIQAHNGYIETYLNLGLIGVALLCTILLSAFFRISAQMRTDVDFARVRMALLLAVMLFNYTEAGFTGVGFVWTVCYIIAIEVPPLSRRAQLAEPDVVAEAQ